MDAAPKSIEIDGFADDKRIDYSICTLVTNKQQYVEMMASFEMAGFVSDRCEFFYLDNSESNKCDAYAGINRFLHLAKGRYIILCHQDILLHDHNIADLDRVIREMDGIDDSWAVLGNAGGVAPGKLAVRITDPFYGQNVKIGDLPARVSSVDENFILVKAAANLSVSRDVQGFHFYGTDLCVIADVLGYSAYVVDFHLHHKCGEVLKSVGRKVADASPDSFNAIRRRYIEKYQRAFRPRWIQTSCAILHISGSAFRNFWANRKYVFSVRKKLHRWGLAKD
jgi:hypothetical protein